MRRTDPFRVDDSVTAADIWPVYRGVFDDGLAHDRLLLMTSADAADPARQLYVSEGWQVLGPGVGDDTVMLGKRVPHQQVAPPFSSYSP